MAKTSARVLITQIAQSIIKVQNQENYRKGVERQSKKDDKNFKTAVAKDSTTKP